MFELVDEDKFKGRKIFWIEVREDSYTAYMKRFINKGINKCEGIFDKNITNIMYIGQESLANYMYDMLYNGLRYIYNDNIPFRLLLMSKHTAINDIEIIKEN